MQHIYVNFKRFDVPSQMGGVNRISDISSYASTIIANRTPKLWDIERKLSVREAARLQGFPDEFKIPVSNAQAYKQFGNSVSVPVLIEIVKQIADSLEVEDE